MKRLLAALIAIMLPHAAWAACANTVSVKDGAGATQTFCVGTDGGTNLITKNIVVDGTAGANAAAVTAANALKVDGSAVTQPVSGTVTANAGTGTFTVSGTVTTSPPANASANLAQIGGVAAVADPCQTVAKVYTPISITTNTRIVVGTAAKKTYICAINLTAPNTNVALVEGTGTVCATGIAGVAGGTTAATGWNFANATAPGVGITQGNGTGSIMATATNADDLCLLVSAANQVSGQIVTVQQ